MKRKDPLKALFDALEPDLMEVDAERHVEASVRFLRALESKQLETELAAVSPSTSKRRRSQQQDVSPADADRKKPSTQKNEPDDNS